MPPTAGATSSHLAREVATQPADWLRARDLARDHAALLPAPGERVALVGCGTSLYVARAVARLRESRGLGVTDAWPAGEPWPDRGYDRVVGISRSGTTTEVLETLERVADGTPVTVVTADPAAPIAALGRVVSLADVDERSVVQSRTATTALALFRWHLGDDLGQAADQAAQVLAIPEERLVAGELREVREAEQIVFAGRGWTVALAEEAALKLTESTRSWTAAYPMTEYRHGPIALAQPGRAVWALGPLVPDLARDVAATGATVVGHDRDPMAELVLVHRLCLVRAADRGLDPDRPRSLSRSIVLEHGPDAAG